MKNTFSLLLAMTMLLCLMTCSYVYAETTTESTEKNQFETISLQTGYLILKKYVDLGTVKNRFIHEPEYDPSFQLASVTVLETNITYYAMRIEALCDGFASSGPIVGIVDRTEFEDVITALNYGKEHAYELAGDNSLSYVTSSGLTLEITNKYVCIIFKGGQISFIPIENIDTLIYVFNQANESVKFNF